MYKNASQVNPLAFKFSLFLSVMIYEENGNQKKGEDYATKEFDQQMNPSSDLHARSYKYTHTHRNTCSEPRHAPRDEALKSG